MSEHAAIFLGRFRLLKQVKKGGMARVFLAVDPTRPDELVAIKTLLPELAGKRSYREMFESEGEVGSRLYHPAIARTLARGDDQKTLWLAMEYVFGVDLSAVLKRLRAKGRTMPVPMAVALAAEVAKALGYAHALTDEFGQPLSIVNRDVSPGNVMLSFDGQVKLIDFGIAQTTIDLKSQIGSIKGKISYMAPEQVRGLPVDHRVDIFSLGTVLYELLTGVQVFRDEGDFATMEKVRRADAPPPSTHNPTIDPLLDGILARALAREAADRYESADAMAAALRTWLERHGGGEGAPARAALLASLFADERAQIEADIAAGLAELADASTQATPAAPMRFLSEAALDDLAEPAVEAPRAAPPGRWWPGVAVAIAVALAGLAVWWVVR